MFPCMKLFNSRTNANTPVLLLHSVSSSLLLQRGKTVLMHAASSGHVEVGKLLIRSGANVNATNEVSIRIMCEQVF